MTIRVLSSCMARLVEMWWGLGDKLLIYVSGVLLCLWLTLIKLNEPKLPFLSNLFTLNACSVWLKRDV